MEALGITLTIILGIFLIVYLIRTAYRYYGNKKLTRSDIVCSIKKEEKYIDQHIGLIYDILKDADKRGEGIHPIGSRSKYSTEELDRLKIYTYSISESSKKIMELNEIYNTKFKWEEEPKMNKTISEFLTEVVDGTFDLAKEPEQLCFLYTMLSDAKLLAKPAVISINGKKMCMSCVITEPERNNVKDAAALLLSKLSYNTKDVRVDMVAITGNGATQITISEE